jgi:hypothetical protein
VDPERPRGAGDAAGDLTAVGDEELVEHVELASGGTVVEAAAPLWWGGEKPRSILQPRARRAR